MENRIKGPGRLVAFDAATRTGWAYRADGQWTTGTLDPTKSATVASMLRKAMTAGVDQVVIEDCYLGRNVATVIALARIQGRILAVCEALGLPVRFVSPNTWKARMLGGRRHRTTDKKASLQRAWKLGAQVTNDDEADAVCLCVFAEGTPKRPEQAKMGFRYKAKKSGKVSE